LNSLGADQLVRKLTNASRGAAEHDHLQASPLVQVDVSGRDDLIEMAVLQFGQALGDPAGLVIVNQGNHTHRLAVFPVDDFLDQRIPHQAPDCLAPVGIAMILSILVEPPQQLAPDRNAEADKWLFHFGLQWAGCVELSLTRCSRVRSPSVNEPVNRRERTRPLESACAPATVATKPLERVQATMPSALGLRFLERSRRFPMREIYAAMIG